MLHGSEVWCPKKKDSATLRRTECQYLVFWYKTAENRIKAKALELKFKISEQLLPGLPLLI